MFSVGQRMSIVFPERSSQRFRHMQLKAMNITDVSVGNALRAFQMAYDTFLNMTDKKCIPPLKMLIHLI